MNPAEVANLLRFASSMDPWLRQTSPEEGAVMVAGWATILEAVPADQAMTYAQWHYSQSKARTITPGDIRGWWDDGLREQQRTADEERTRQLVGAGAQPALSPELTAPVMSEYLAKVRDVLAVGGDVSAILKPDGAGTLSPSADAWMRRCRWHEVCTCTHTDCRDGWLDREGAVTSELGKVYPAVQRCPTCDDAFQMWGERTITRRPAARRR